MALTARRVRRCAPALLVATALVVAGATPVLARDKTADRLNNVRKTLRQQEEHGQERTERIENLLSEIRSLDSRLLASGRNRASLEAEEGELEDEYRQHMERLASLESEQEKSRELLAHRLSSIYKRGRLGNSRTLVQAATSSEPIRMARYLAAVAKADSSAFDDYDSVRRKHRLAIGELEAKKADITEKQKALRSELGRYESARGEKQQLLASIEQDVAVGRLRVEELRASEAELQKVMASASREPDRDVEKDKDSKKGRPSALARLFGRRKKPEPFADRMGELQAPVRGEIVSKFGEKRASGPRVQGVLVRVSRDYQVTSVASGEVVFSGPFPGLGKTLIVNHGDRYHTVYAHLDVIQHEVGGRVKENEVIGSVARDDPTLHFELRAEGKATDPEPWFPGGYAAFDR